MLREGVDLKKLRRKDPARAWNVLYSFMIENREKKDRERFDADLFQRPVGANTRRGDSFDKELKAAAAQYLKSLPPNFGQIDSKEEKTGEA